MFQIYITFYCLQVKWESEDPVVRLVQLEQQAILETLDHLAVLAQRERKEREDWMAVRETQDQLGLLVLQ